MIGDIPRADDEFTIHDYVPGQPVPILIRDPKTGKVYSNELKQYIKPYTLVTEPDPVVLGPNQLSDPIPMIIDGAGHFEIMSAFFSSSQPEGFTVELRETGERPLLMNREVHVATIASGGGVVTAYEVFGPVGSAGRPFRWPESFFMEVSERNRAIMATFRNLSPNQNTIRFNLHGLRWYHSQAPGRIAQRMQEIYRHRFRSMPFFYTTESNVILAADGVGAFAEPEIRFTDESWLELHKQMRFSTGRFNVRIREKASGKTYMHDPILDTLVFGNGEFPFLMWEPGLYEPDYKLTYELTNLAGVENTVWITLGCRKIFWDQRDDKLLRPEDAGGMP